MCQVVSKVASKVVWQVLHNRFVANGFLVLRGMSFVSHRMVSSDVKPVPRDAKIFPGRELWKENFMKRSAGIVFAAVVLLLLTLAGLLCTLLTTAAMFLNRYPIIPHTVGIQTMVGTANLLLFCFLAFCLWTVVGLFRLQPGTPVRMILVGVATAVVAGLIGVEFLRLRALIPPGMLVPGENLQVVSVALMLAGAYFVAALIGVWWVVYFSLPGVRRRFNPAVSLVAK